MLTAQSARLLKPQTKIYRRFDEKGLYLEVHPSGRKYWRFKYRFGGKEKRIALGVYPEVSLSEARAKRDASRAKLRNGTDPSEEKRLEKLRQKTLSEETFGAIGREWMDREKPNWSKTHIERQTRIFEKDLALLARRPVAEITAVELLCVFRRW